MAVVGGVVAFLIARVDGDGSSDGSSEPVGTNVASGEGPGSPPADTAPATQPPASTMPPAGRSVDVDEVWLLDRGDGDFDWGLTVDVPEGAETRSDVAVRVRLIDEEGDLLDEVERSLDGVSDRGPSAVAGRFEEEGGVPARLDFDVTVGSPSDDLGLPDLLAVRAVERDGDELSGRIRSSAVDDVTDVAMVLVWRGEPEAGEATASVGLDSEPRPIIDVVVYEIDRLRPAVDAVFEIDLADLRTPDGLPDDVFWAPSR